MLQYTINLADSESDQIYWNLTLPNSNLSLNSSFTNNSFLIQWTPLKNETGTYKFILNYYDTYHQSNPSNYAFQIIVNLSDPPYFTQNLTNMQVEAWKASIYTFPSADVTRIVNFTPQFSINVTQKSKVPLPSWITYSSFNLTFNAMIDQVGVTNQTLDVSLSESASGLSSNYSFNYSVIDNMVVNFLKIPDFNVSDHYSITQNLNSYWPPDSSIKISLDYPSEYDRICVIIFDPTSKVLTIVQNKTDYSGALTMTLIATDLWGRKTLSNQFNINLVGRLSPWVTNSLPTILMNKIDLNTTYKIPSLLFYEKSQNISLGFYECIGPDNTFVTKNSQFVSSPLSRFLIISKIPDFSGSCEFGITGTNSFNQTALATTTLQVNQWIAKNWIEWSNVLKCTMWADGYSLMPDSSWILAATYKNIKYFPEMFKYGFLIFIASFFIYIILVVRWDRMYMFFTNMQLILVVSALSSSTNLKTKAFLVAFYWFKGDLRFIDYFIPMCQKYCDEVGLKAVEKNYEFYCYSTFINYIWTIIFILIAFWAYVFYQNWKNKVILKDIVKSIPHNMHIEIIFDFIFPFIILSIFLELGNMLKSPSVFSMISLLLIIAILVLLIIKFDTKLNPSYPISTRFYKWMFYAKILVIWNQILSFTIITILVFLYIIFLCVLIKFWILPKQNPTTLTPSNN